MAIRPLTWTPQRAQQTVFSNCGSLFWDAAGAVPVHSLRSAQKTIPINTMAISKRPMKCLLYMVFALLRRLASAPIIERNMINEVAVATRIRHNDMVLATTWTGARACRHAVRNQFLQRRNK